MLDWMPQQASQWASRVDWINNVITWSSVYCTIAVTGVMLYFAIRYRHKPGENRKTPYSTHNSTLETVWTVIPTIVVIYMFWYGYHVYSEMRNPPANALEINVDAYKWRWEFEHPSGKKATNELYVPLGRAVRLIMKSHDVIHSFFIPAMRVKEDVLGNVYSYLWFTPTVAGDFPIFCTEYCGTGHSAMLARLKVVTPEQYDDYVLERGASEVPELPPAELGAQLFKQKTCNTCHSVDGTALPTAPTLKGVYGHKVELTTGEIVEADENYLRESILESTKKVVKGFAPIMPAFSGQLSDKEVAALIAYIKTLAQ